MIASVQRSVVAPPRRLVVKSGAGLKTAPRHHRKPHNRNDACVLNDKKAAAPRANISADVPTVDQFLLADVFDVIFRFPACVHKPAVRFQYGTHDTTLPASPTQCTSTGTVSQLFHDLYEYFYHLDVELCRDGIPQRNVSRTHLTFACAAPLQFGPIYIPTYAEKITNRIAAHIASRTSIDLRRNLFTDQFASALMCPAKQIKANKISKPINPGISFPLRRRIANALQPSTAQQVEAGTQYKPSLHPSLRGASQQFQSSIL